MWFYMELLIILYLLVLHGIVYVLIILHHVIILYLLALHGIAYVLVILHHLVLHGMHNCTCFDNNSLLFDFTWNYRCFVYYNSPPFGFTCRGFDNSPPYGFTWN